MAKTRRRKKRTHVASDNNEVKKPDPKTLVFKRGKHGAILADLEQDVRRMMLPNTALNLKESRRNTLRDFVSVAGPLGVTHFVMMSATENSSYLKLSKTPRGPTVTMRVRSYSLVRDVQAAAARPRMPVNAFKTAPLVVMNGFSGDDTLRLVTTMFQGMFPVLNVQRTKLSACQRVVLLSRDRESGVIRLRHYSIAVAPSGLRKSVKALVSNREVPDLGTFRDVSEFVTKSGYGSESEGEDAEASRVTLAQNMGRGNVAARQSRVRLHELGPRLDLELIKIEEGMCDGAVLFHAHVSKTREEAAELASRQEQRQALKEQRKKQQEANVRRKAAEAARKAAAKAEQMRKEGKLPAEKMWWEQDPAEVPGSGSEDEEEDEEGNGEEEGNANGEGGAAKSTPKKRRRTDGNGDEEDDDAAYFREEVGRDPEADEMVGANKGGGGRRGRGGRGRGRGRTGGRSGGRGVRADRQQRDGGGGRGERGRGGGFRGRGGDRRGRRGSSRGRRSGRDGAGGKRQRR